MNITLKLVLTYGALINMKKQAAMYSITTMMKLGRILKNGILAWV